MITTRLLVYFKTKIEDPGWDPFLIIKEKPMSGIVAIKSNTHIGNKIIYSLNAIQHRGADYFKISLYDKARISKYKSHGLVDRAFRIGEINENKAKLALGEVGSFNLSNSKNLIDYKDLDLGFDGNITNNKTLAQKELGIDENIKDDQLIAGLFKKFIQKDLIKTIRKMMDILEGAYSVVIIYEGKILAFKDYSGIRPLILGYDEKDFIISSEHPAIDILEIEKTRDLRAGEIILIEDKEIKSFYDKKRAKPRACIFEQIYTSRVDSNLGGINSYEFRKKSGELLAKNKPVKADIVCPIPDSGIPAALGYAKESGIDFEMGIVRNRYVGRSFIKSSQSERELAVRLKLAALKSVVAGKDVILVDDSIVRGTTCAKLIKKVKMQGAKKVHLKIASPPVKHPCFYGIETRDINTLVAARLNIEQIRDKLGADSLDFLSIKDLQSLIGYKNTHCMACFSGDYPTGQVDR